jgi:hypothetical protein
LAASSFKGEVKASLRGVNQEGNQRNKMDCGLTKQKDVLAYHKHVCTPKKMEFLCQKPIVSGRSVQPTMKIFLLLALLEKLESDSRNKSKKR